MLATPLKLVLLLVTGFGLATWLQPRFHNWARPHTQSASLLTVLLGDSRQLFAQHFYEKADAYFHGGYYPSIFEERSGNLHLATGAVEDQDGEPKCPDVLGQPKDWLDRFSRNFYPSRHIHLGAKGPSCTEDHHRHGEARTGEHDCGMEGASEARELLPWLRLAADLDPQRAETYVIASYWMRSRLGKVTEAEQFLREGLRTNPGHPDLLFELGRICHENRQDPTRARNLWELALAKWRERELSQSPANRLVYLQLLGNLAKLEQEQGRYAQAIQWLQELSEVSPSKDYIQKWIEELQARQVR